MRTLVTGGGGFIGSHLVDSLLAAGHEVDVLDNFCTGRRDNLGKNPMAGKVRVWEKDIAAAVEILPLFKGVDWVFHLAGLADIVPSVENPSAYFHSNVDGTLAVMEAARAARVKRFLYAASSSCYGIPDAYPTPETAPIRPRYPYALTKWLGEEIVLHWAEVYKMPAVSLRLFNVFGPRSRTTGAYGAVFGVFLAQKLNGKPFTVVGDGTQTRDFTYVTDVARAFLQAAESDLSGVPLNIGTGQCHSVNELVGLLGGGPKVRLPRRPGEPDCTHADIARVRELLGWEPLVSFAEGVRRVLERIEDWRDAPVWTAEKIQEATRSWFDSLRAT
ncbi:MAG: SDR family oxidoreductase [Nitrospirae bacterium]|nr:SDR family oxidoreductase [Nitrospirota bacterium]